MTQEEYNKLLNISSGNKLITADDLKNKEDRTLIYGVVIRNPFYRHHVYIKNGVIRSIQYYLDEDKGNMDEIIVKKNNDYKAGVKIYPELCDYEFLSLLRGQGVKMSFYKFDKNVICEENSMCGVTIEGIKFFEEGGYKKLKEDLCILANKFVEATEYDNFYLKSRAVVMRNKNKSKNIITIKENSIEINDENFVCDNYTKYINDIQNKQNQIKDYFKELYRR